MRNIHTHFTLKVLLVLGMLAYMGISGYNSLEQLRGEHCDLIGMDVEKQNDSKETEESVADTELEETVVYPQLNVSFSCFNILKTASHGDQKRFLFLIDYLELSTPPPEYRV